VAGKKRKKRKDLKAKLQRIKRKREKERGTKFVYPPKKVSVV
jgi:hypothetical protein